MAEEFKDQATNLNVDGGEEEVKDRGLFDFVHKKKEEEEKKPPEGEEGLVAGVEKIHIDDHKAEEKEEEKKHGLLEKLHRSHSSSSSSSSSNEEEEVEGEGGIKEKIKKKKKKKGLKEKPHGGEKKEKEEESIEPAFAPAGVQETPVVVVEKVDVFDEAVAPPEEEKKGFLDKIKEKLPGHGKKAAEEGGAFPPPPLQSTVEVLAEHVKEEVVEGKEVKEKKGFLGKIMEKLPGYHKNTGEEAEKNPGSH